MYLPGIDTSLWDAGPKPFMNIMNWAQYPWHYAFIKVGEGTFIDPAFLRQWTAAKGHIYRGAYHFFRPAVDPKTSVARTIEYLGGDLGELPLALDLEVTDGRADVLDRAKSWMAWYEARTGVRPILYTSPSFLTENFAYRYTYLKSFKLWLAQYYYDKWEPAAVRDAKIERVLAGQDIPSCPKPPAPFERVSFWQWTALLKPHQIGGYYMGSDGKKEIDGIFYLGTLTDLVAEFNLPDLPALPPSQNQNMTVSIHFA